MLRKRTQQQKKNKQICVKILCFDIHLQSQWHRRRINSRHGEREATVQRSRPKTTPSRSDPSLYTHWLRLRMRNRSRQGKSGHQRGSRHRRWRYHRGSYRHRCCHRGPYRHWRRHRGSYHRRCRCVQHRFDAVSQLRKPRSLLRVRPQQRRNNPGKFP